MQYSGDISSDSLVEWAPWPAMSPVLATFFSSECWWQKNVGMTADMAGQGAHSTSHQPLRTKAHNYSPITKATHAILKFRMSSNPLLEIQFRIPFDQIRAEHVE